MASAMLERSGIQRQREQPSAEGLRVPHLNRQGVLIHLLAKFRTLTKEQVGQLADRLYDDTVEGTVRPLAQVLTDSGLIDEKSKLRQDPLFAHVGLKYEKTEMETAHSPRAIGSDEMSRGVIDTFSGYGSSKPLLFDLYMATACGGSVYNADTSTFTISNLGNRLSMSMGSLLEHRADALTRNNSLIVLGRNVQEIYRQTPQLAA